ncbi:thymidine phosphorylase family protein [Marinobacter zhejiangensis]|nr:thymidine phosphorylase family protein [Marinobacter zhejiangensis]
MTSHYTLKALDIGINTHQEAVAYMREDCHVCRAEGFTAKSRVKINHGSRSVVATVNVVDNDVLPEGHVGLSKVAIQRLGVGLGDDVVIGHADVVASLAAVRKKVFGNPLDGTDMQAIITDISDHLYSDIEIATFLSVCAGGRLDTDEIVYLTQAMVNAGKRLHWPGREAVYDKHCIGGLPGNRTTPLVVSIVSAAGHVMPKTSSRAITSPAGTADTMEALTNVNLELADIRRVVNETGACLTWGGAVNLSPADDVLIRIERALDLDGEGQMIASVLSKKIAAGSTHTLIDIPVGPTAKVRSGVDAGRLASLFTQVGAACGLKVRCVLTDGSQPVGRGIGPVEEARDLLAVLRCEEDAPSDLRERALLLAGHVLDMAEHSGLEIAQQKAMELLVSGEAYRQFLRIVESQGGLKTLQDARFQHAETALLGGTLRSIDNRKLARLAKLSGAPSSPGAGLRLYVKVGDQVATGAPLFTLYSESQGEQDYALDYYRQNADMFVFE